LPNAGVKSAYGAALGGTRRDVFGGLFVRHLGTVVSGLLAGLLLSASITHATASMLFGVNVFDPLSFSAAAVMLLLTACVACAIPLWRATAVQPAAILRPEC
jgi:ABC-type antimicrobial peptide transport system permease subunit